jgi:hypothetical protein
MVQAADLEAEAELLLRDLAVEQAEQERQAKASLAEMDSALLLGVEAAEEAQLP